MISGRFNPDFKCPLCNRFHAIRQCSKFIVMDVERKLRTVAQLALCYNCLAQSHSRAACKSVDRCHGCRQDHNSWLHPLPKDRLWVQMTAQVTIIAGPGETEQRTRALIDPTVARSTITRREAERLQCLIHQGKTFVSMANRRISDRAILVELVVEDKSYPRSPVFDVTQVGGDRSRDADRIFYRSREYNIILGADVQSKVLKGPAKGKAGSMYVQDTIFGYAFFGEGVKAVEMTTDA